jgi:hypothetical protein
MVANALSAGPFPLLPSKAVPALLRRNGVGGALIGPASHQISRRLSARAKLLLPDSPKPASAFAGFVGYPPSGPGKRGDVERQFWSAGVVGRLTSPRAHEVSAPRPDQERRLGCENASLKVN